MKRIISLAMALAIVFLALPTLAYAASDYTLGESGTGSTQIDLGTVRPDTYYRLEINADGSPATRTDIRNDKIDVKTKATEGNKAFDGITIAYDGDTPYVKVAFVPQHVSTKELDFSITVYLTKNKSRIDSTSVTLYGTLENHYQIVDASDDFVYMADTPVVEASEFIRKIEVEVGQGLYINARMNADRRYYAYVTRTPDSLDEERMNKYPNIDMVYALTSINMNGASNTVRIETGTNYYVYNSGMEYIGRTSEELPYSTRFYLSTVELDIDPGDVEPSDDPPPDDDDLNDDPDADGSGYTGNAGAKNPNTGDRNFAALAAVAGMLSLVALGVLTLGKKKKSAR